MTRDIHTKREFSNLLLNRGLVEDYNHFATLGVGEPALLAFQEIVDLTKLEILCNDLSMSFEVSSNKSSNVVRIDDLRYWNASYAVFNFIQALPLEYLQIHNYLYFNDYDLTELLRGWHPTHE